MTSGVGADVGQACFHEKDFLNYRYHAKRASYLATVAQRLDASGLYERVEWAAFKGDLRKPVLLLKPSKARSQLM